MKKETLKEAAKENFKGEYVCNGVDIVPAWREGFIVGAKWQQEQDNKMYSELSIYLQQKADEDRLKSLTSNQIRAMIEQFKK